MLIAILPLLTAIITFSLVALHPQTKKKIDSKLDTLTLWIDYLRPIKILNSFSSPSTAMHLEATAYTLTGFVAALCLLLFENEFKQQYSILILGAAIGFAVWALTYIIIRIFRRKTSIIILWIASNGGGGAIAKRLLLLIVCFGASALLLVLSFDVGENLSVWISYPLFILIVIPLTLVYAYFLYILMPPILFVLACLTMFGLLQTLTSINSKYLYWCENHRSSTLAILAATIIFAINVALFILKVF